MVEGVELNGSDPVAEEIIDRLFTTPEGRSDPYPLYHALRERAPVHYSPAFGAWFFTRYDDVDAITRDPRFDKSYARQMQEKFGPGWRDHPALTLNEKSMINVDGPEHARLRRLVIKAFTRRTIDRMRPEIERIMGELIEPFGEAGGGDWMSDVAFLMPVTVIGELLGVPASDRPQFRDWVADLLAVFEMQVSDDDLSRADVASGKIMEYFYALIDEKRRRPDDQLLSRLTHAEDSGDRLTREELGSMALLIFGAGFETTTNLLGNGLLALLRQPDQLALLRERPALLPLLPDELLRYDGTAQMVVRGTCDAVEVGGVELPAGQTVYGILGAANRDPSHFPNPDVIDVTRGRFRPMSFGGGAHFCLGASLARAEIEIGMRMVLERFDSVELVDERPPKMRDRLTLRGLDALHLAVKPAAARLDLTVPEGDVRAMRAAAKVREPAPGSATASGARPPAGTQADRVWRNELRSQVEKDVDSGLLQTGTNLAATIVLIARADLFARCSASEIAALAATAYPLSFEEGDLLCEEGAESLECYVIAEGEAQVTIAGEPVRRVSVNDVVGERGPLEGHTRSATVRATGHMLTYAISRQRLLALAEESPEAKRGMLAFIASRYPD